MILDDDYTITSNANELVKFVKQFRLDLKWYVNYWKSQYDLNNLPWTLHGEYPTKLILTDRLENTSISIPFSPCDYIHITGIENYKKLLYSYKSVIITNKTISRELTEYMFNKVMDYLAEHKTSVINLRIDRTIFKHR